MKRIISLLMTFILMISFTGCKGKEVSSDTAKNVSDISNGEKDIGKNAGLANIASFNINSKNQLIILGVTEANEKKFGIYDADGKLVKDIKIDFGEKLGVCALDAEDNIYVLNEDASKRQINVFNASGDKIKTINAEKHADSSKEPEEPSQEDIAIKGKMEIDSKGNFYILMHDDKRAVEMLNKEGKSVKILYNHADFMCSDGEDNLLVERMGFSDNGGNRFYIEKINPDSGQKLWKKEVPINKIPRNMIYRKGDKNTYVLSSDGVSKYSSSDWKFVEQVMDFKDYGLVDFNSRVTNININKNNDVYVLYSKIDRAKRSEKSDLLRYSLNANSKKNKKIITLSLMYKDQYVDVAISKFQRLHPDIKIEVENTIGDFNAPSSYEKYIKDINTEIMAGKGSDIISMSSLPYQKYADKKAIVNLNDFISNDKEFNMKDYNENIINGFKYKGGIYTLPIDYEFSTLAVNKKILNEEKIDIGNKKWTWQELIANAEKVTKDKNGDGKIDQYAFPNMKGSEILNDLLLNNDYSEFVDIDKKQAKFDSKEFIHVLNLVKEFTDKKIMDTKGDGMSLNSAENVQFLVGDTVFIPTIIFSSVALGDKFDLLNLSAQGGSKGGSFTSSNMFSINKNSKYKKECWEFIKFMLSEDMQAGLGISFPVNKLALDKVQKHAIESSKDMRECSVTQEDINTLNKFIGNLSNANNENTQISKIVEEETDKFIKGQQTAEQAAKIIQNKVSTMLNE